MIIHNPRPWDPSCSRSRDFTFPSIRGLDNMQSLHFAMLNISTGCLFKKQKINKNI